MLNWRGYKKGQNYLNLNKITVYYILYRVTLQFLVNYTIFSHQKLKIFFFYLKYINDSKKIKTLKDDEKLIFLRL